MTNPCGACGAFGWPSRLPHICRAQSRFFASKFVGRGHKGATRGPRRTGPFGWCSIYFKADLVDPLGSVRAWVTARPSIVHLEADSAETSQGLPSSVGETSIHGNPALSEHRLPGESKQATPVSYFEELKACALELHLGFFLARPLDRDRAYRLLMGIAARDELLLLPRRRQRLSGASRVLSKERCSLALCGERFAEGLLQQVQAAERARHNVLWRRVHRLALRPFLALPALRALLLEELAHCPPSPDVLAAEFWLAPSWREHRAMGRVGVGVRTPPPPVFCKTYRAKLEQNWKRVDRILLRFAASLRLLRNQRLTKRGRVTSCLVNLIERFRRGSTVTAYAWKPGCLRGTESPRAFPEVLVWTSVSPERELAPGPSVTKASVLELLAFRRIRAEGLWAGAAALATALLRPQGGDCICFSSWTVHVMPVVLGTSTWMSLLPEQLDAGLLRVDLTGRLQLKLRASRAQSLEILLDFSSIALRRSLGPQRCSKVVEAKQRPKKDSCCVVSQSIVLPARTCAISRVSIAATGWQREMMPSHLAAFGEHVDGGVDADASWTTAVVLRTATETFFVLQALPALHATDCRVTGKQTLASFWGLQWPVQARLAASTWILGISLHQAPSVGINCIIRSRWQVRWCHRRLWALIAPSLKAVSPFPDGEFPKLY
ncbi:unnamed protein product [Symbiodinium necroappetens]|uniref:Uncharacterized protein n=1 Tax=Symbiodinium necroappetens TaxID=1628268 RepID=A0A812SRE2_9DINO|nr:unnamed protein product [Symbiodinium necroappetens]